MPRLIVIADTFTREREAWPLREGARLADELMRLFPEKIDGPWKLYEEEVSSTRELPPEAIVARTVLLSDVFYLVRLPGAALTAVQLFWVNLGLAVLFGAVTKLLTPKPRNLNTTQSEDRESGTNQLAGQTNVLRPGARVPDILGRMRVFPDLLTPQVEEWRWPNTQDLTQLFCVGVGTYQYSPADLRLGDTLLTAIAGSSQIPYPPGTLVPKFPAVRTAATIDNLSLDATTSSDEVPASNVTFSASAKTLSSPTRLELTAGVPFRVVGGLNTGRDFWCESVPPPSVTSPPYVYQLAGPVVDEPSANPKLIQYGIFTGAATITSSAWGIYFTDWTRIDFGLPIGAGDSPGVLTGAWLMEAVHAGTRYRRHVTEAYYRFDEPTTVVLATDLTCPVDIDNAATNFPTWDGETSTNFKLWNIPPGSLSRAAEEPGTTAALTPLPTLWYRAPLDAPDELWVDIAFPQGLVHYASGNASNYSVNVRVEIRRVGNDATKITVDLPTFTSNRAVYMRSTNKFNLTDPTSVNYHPVSGSGPLEVRVTRMTTIPISGGTDQYTTDARWASFRAVKFIPERRYTDPDFTLQQVLLENTRSASSLGENSFNMVVTRVCDHWDSATGTWSKVASEKWADNFLTRVRAKDGANITNDSLIDLPGIYTLQSQLDLQDPITPGDTNNGQQGMIALVLDQPQDIDNELAQICDVIRAQHYRVGRKIFVARDAQTSQRMALFNGRAKSSDGESVSVRFKSSDEHDAVSVQWLDIGLGWKQREYVYPPIAQPANVLRVSAQCANWPQAWRRARYEWNKLRYRREQISVSVTEDGRICRPGDVVNITDDVANLANAAGEVIYVSGNVLTLDQRPDFVGSSFTILLRDLRGQAVDAIPCTAVAGSPNKVQLSRAPIAGVTIKPRDEALGTLYAFFNDVRATVRQWLVTGVEVNGPYVQLSGVNYSDAVYAGDAGPVDPIPTLGDV